MTDQQLYIHSPSGMHIIQPILSIEDLSCNHITVQPPVEVGSAHIVSVPTGAKIFIDNIEYTGLITPTTISDIPIGTYTYKLTYPGYTDVNGILFIKTGETYDISTTMEKYSVPSQSNALLYLGLFAVGFMLLSSRKKESTEIDYESIHEMG